MGKINVLVINFTGSVKRPAELCLSSGILRFEDGEYSHISRHDKVWETKEAPKLAVISSAPDRSDGDSVAKSGENKSRRKKHSQGIEK